MNDVPRDDMSETILALMSVFTFLLLFVCPGGFFLFLLPWWIGLPLALGCGAFGPWMLWRLDIDLYGPRDSDRHPNGRRPNGSGSAATRARAEGIAERTKP